MKIPLHPCVYIKTILFTFLILIIFQLFGREVCKFLKSRLIFILSYCFHISDVLISQKIKSVLMWNLPHIIFMWRQKYWQILKSPLVYLLIHRTYHAANVRILVFGLFIDINSYLKHKQVHLKSKKVSGLCDVHRKLRKNLSWKMHLFSWGLRIIIG